MSKIKQKIQMQSVQSYAEEATLIYGTEVLENRAVPDYRDGLKPVQRALLWSMYNLKLHYDGPYKKSARTVGDCVGLWQPRGDSPTYGAMAGLVNSPIPLIDGYGNWGSHVEEPAAMRYCVVAGTKIMTEYGLINIEKIPKLHSNICDNPKTITQIDTNYSVSSTQPNSVATKWLNSGKQETIIVTTTNGYKIQCTLNQPFLILDKDLNYVWKPIESLSVGDSVCLTGGYIDYNIESKLSVEDAFLLGVLTKTVINGNSILYSDIKLRRFNNVCKILTTYYKCSSSQSIKNDKNYCLVEINLDSQNFPQYQWNEYTSHVPSDIFECDDESVAAFCRAIVIMYSKIRDYSLYLSCRSENLLCDVKLLFLNYFGVISTAIVPENNGYFTMQLYSNDLCEELNIIPESILKNLRKIEYVNRIPNLKIWMQQQIIEAYTNDFYSDSDIENLKVLSDCSEILYRQTIMSLSNCFIMNKIKSVVESNYIYDTIASKEQSNVQYTFDLTVDGSHAFFANGFILHNTEARLSKFADSLLLDPEYLGVIEMQKNYSEDRLLPTVLPAKVPNMLLMGNTSIAVGISASSAPFALKGVLKLTKKVLLNEKLTANECAKFLNFNYKYGGNCVSSNREKIAVIKSGKGTLEFEPNYVLDYKNREFVITSTCPGLNSSGSLKTLFKKIESIPGVKMIFDAEDRGGIKYTIQFGKIGDEKIKAGFDEISKCLLRKECYDFGVVERLPTNTNFFRTNVIDILERWCKWRIEIELRVIQKRILQSQNTSIRLALCVKAVNNIDIIVEALKRDNSEKFLVNRMKISEDDAKYIMNMKLHSLKKLNLNTLQNSIKEQQKILIKHQKDYQLPVNGIISTLDSVL